MSFAGDLPADGSGADYSDLGAGDRTGAATLPFSDSLAATASGAFMSGIRGLSNYIDLDQQAYRARLDRQFDVEPSVDPGGASIDPQEWQKKYPDLGIQFTPDMGVTQAQMLVDHKQDENRRQYILDNSPNSFLAKSTRGLTDFALQALDPVNIAATFMPGMSEARAGLLAERFGPWVGRALEGGAAGATGTAALQPLQYAEAKAYQDQYGPMDAFLNVAFGTVLGGGLHVGAGAISDLLSRAAPETREAALRASVAQSAEGRDVDVTPVLASDPEFYPKAPEAQGVIDAADQYTAARAGVDTAQAGVDDAATNFESARQSLATRSLAENTGVGALDPDTLQRLNAISAELKGTIPAKRRAALIREQDMIRGSIGEQSPELGQLLNAHDDAKAALDQATEAHATATTALNEAVATTARTNEQFRELAAKISPVSADVIAKKAGVDLGPEARTAAKTQRVAARTAIVAGDTTGIPPDALAAEARTLAVRTKAEAQSAAPALIENAKEQSLKFARGQEASRVEASPELSDRVASEVRSGLGDDPQVELQTAMDQLNGYRAQGVVTDGDMAHFDLANEKDTEAAKVYSDAAEAAARCLFLHP